MATQRQQIIDFVLEFPDRDDDEIALALRFTQRQTVNVLCRALMAEGIIERSVGPRGKLVNRSRSELPLATDVTARADIEIVLKPRRPPLAIATLTAAGFRKKGDWRLNKEGHPHIEGSLPNVKGVYAFASVEAVFYVGVTGIGLKKRLYSYENPGSTQTTNIRLHALIRASLADGETVSVYTAVPPDFEWGGLTVNGRAGLEVGLIESFYLPWNVRGVA